MALPTAARSTKKRSTSSLTAKTSAVSASKKKKKKNRKKPHKPYIIVGWRETIALPELGVEAIKVKVDTGARTSAIHATDIKFTRRGDKRFVRFVVHPVQRSTDVAVAARAEVIDERVVRNSGGEEELRPVIRTLVEVLGQRWPIEVTLTRRDVMGFRMLLGREALSGRVLVDPGHSFCT